MGDYCKQCDKTVEVRERVIYESRCRVCDSVTNSEVDDDDDPEEVS